jgi:hypothetical protein
LIYKKSTRRRKRRRKGRRKRRKRRKRRTRRTRRTRRSYPFYPLQKTASYPLILEIASNSSTMPHLLELPYEVLNCIFREADPPAWAAASQSCRELRHFVQNNHLLYKNYYLQNWVYSTYIFITVRSNAVRIIPCISARRPVSSGKKMYKIW